MESIVYEDSELIIFHKPAGIPAQTSRFGQKDVVSILKNYRAGRREEPYIALINRLDQPVEGLMLAAKTKQSAAFLSSRLASDEIQKIYRAVVCNCRDALLLPGDTMVLTDYLLKDGQANHSKAVPKGTARAKKAVLSYEVLKIKEKLAEVSIHLLTGRHHQIRVQMANASLPLLGDLKYGIKKPADSPAMQLALCSVKISFIHPKTRKKMEFETKPQNPAFQLLCGVHTA
ncbi:MAG: RluA family pseudouridine synthase [Eubacterium sp.]|jgi:23S rRNA pseudouridine1911/1915/1917 synthase|nr:RluA family pseudouridine synthase [Eubacterium sp.]NBI85388.1 RluA family pseudouridine synthase [Lachnospiraceae bacterium]